MIKIIYTSDVGVGAILLQGGKDDIDLLFTINLYFNSSLQIKH
jgi:hypothetical protein